MTPSPTSVLLSISLFLASAIVAQAADSVTAQCLTKDRKIIPLYVQCGQLWTTNVKAPDIVIINRGSDSVTITGVEITALVKGEKVAASYFTSDLPSLVRQVNAQFRNKFGAEPLDEVQDPHMSIAFGIMQFAHTRLSETETLAPGECAVVLLSRALYVTYTGFEKVDDLTVTVRLKHNDETQEIPCPVHFVPYECRGGYVFPLKGSLCLSNLPTNFGHHRSALSQEFAFDARDAQPADGSHPPGTDKPLPAALSDYPIYRRDVVAIGDGLVVEVGNGFPESLTLDPWTYSPAKFQELMAHLEPKIGFKNTASGNYIVLDHQNGEFGFYAHLSEGTIRVKEGDHVAQGDVIASVGNTGNSSEPHLHFQLMDSKDPLLANGLPVMFKNVPPQTMNQFCKSANSLSATDYIFLRIDGHPRP